MILPLDPQCAKASYVTPFSSRCPQRPLSSPLSPISPNVPMHPHSSGRLQSPRDCITAAPLCNFDFNLPVCKAQGTAEAWSDDSTHMTPAPMSTPSPSQATDPAAITPYPTSHPFITCESPVDTAADHLCWPPTSTAAAACQSPPAAPGYTVTRWAALGCTPVASPPPDGLDAAREKWLTFTQDVLGDYAHEVLHTAPGLQRLSHAVRELQKHASRRQSNLFLSQRETLCAQYVQMTSSQLQPLQRAIRGLRAQLSEVQHDACGHRDALRAMQAQGAEVTNEREQLVTENEQLKAALEHAWQRVRL